MSYGIPPHHPGVLLYCIVWVIGGISGVGYTIFAITNVLAGNIAHTLAIPVFMSSVAIAMALLRQDYEMYKNGYSYRQQS